MRFKNNIFISCGIEITNYEKALGLIREQLEQMKNGDFSEQDIEEAKKGIVATIKTIDDEQDTQITYYFAQELSQDTITVEEYEQKIKDVKKEEIVNIANNTKFESKRKIIFRKTRKWLNSYDNTKARYSKKIHDLGN